MRIIHFSTYDKGGAGMAAVRITENLSNSGHDSVLLVSQKMTDSKFAIEVSKSKKKKLINCFLRPILQRTKYRAVDWNYYAFYHQLKRSDSTINNIYESMPYTPDLIVLHWVEGFIGLDEINKISQKFQVPILWYMMDYAPLTGGCHYFADCKNYMNNCGNCPALRYSSENDISYRNLKEKKEKIKGLNIGVLAGSSNGRRTVEESALFRHHKVGKFYLTSEKGTGEYAVLRKKYGVDEQSFLVLVGAQDLNNPFKGGRDFIESLNNCFKSVSSSLKENLLFVFIGQSADQLSNEILFNSISLGYLSSKVELFNVYDMIDLYVCTSLVDAGPQMINECVFNRIPVVAFNNVGVADDLIVHGKNGLLVDKGDFGALSKSVVTLSSYNANEFKKLKNYCDTIAKDKLSSEQQVIEIERMYEMLTKRNRDEDTI